MTQRPSNEQGLVKVAFWLLVVLFVAEFPRPTVLAVLKVQLLIVLILTAILIFGRKTKIRDSRLTAGFLLLFLICLSVIYSVNNFSAYQAARAVYGFLVIGLTLAWVARERSYRAYLIDIWIVLLVYCGLYGILHNGRGPGGFMGDENDMALAASVGLSFSLFGAASFKGIKRWLYGLAAAVMVGGIVTSMSRGGFLAGASVVAFFLFSQRGLLKKLTLIATAVMLFFFLAPDEYVQEIATIGTEAQSTTDDTSTATHRYYLWATGFNMFLDNPIVGVGAQNFPWRAGAYQPLSGNWPDALLERSMYGVVSHSTYVDIFAELGSVGAALWFFMLGSTLITLRRLFVKNRNGQALDQIEAIDRFHALGLSGALIGYLGAAATLSVPYYPYPWYIMGLACALIGTYQHGDSREPHVAWGVKTARPSHQEALIGHDQG